MPRKQHEQELPDALLSRRLKTRVAGGLWHCLRDIFVCSLCSIIERKNDDKGFHDKASSVSQLQYVLGLLLIVNREGNVHAPSLLV